MEEKAGLKQDNDTTFSGVILDFKFVNEKVGWAIGEKDLFKTEDSGISWVKYTYHNEIRKIIPVSELVCYVLFEDRNVNKTIDGGLTWDIYQFIIGGPSPEFRNLNIDSWHAINNSTFIFIFVGIHGSKAFYKTMNGFKTAELIGGISAKRGFWAPSYLELFASNNGIALSSSYILRTSNQGEDWDVIHSVKIFKQLNFIDEHLGYLDDYDRILYRTINGGENWISIKSPASDPNYQGPFYFINEDTGFVGGIKSIYKTIDGGESWKKVVVYESKTLIPINYIYFTDDQNGWVLAEVSNYIYQTTNCGESWEKVNIGFEGRFHSIDFADKNNGFVVGSNISSGYPFVAKTTDGGVIWEHVTTGAYKFVDLDQVTPTLGFAVAAGSGIFCSKDSWTEHNSWEKQYENYNAWLKSIYMIDSLNGFVCGCYFDWEFGKYGYILRTNNGGKEWEENYSIKDIELNDIQFIDDNTGWVVGENGLVLRTTNGGVTWVENEQESIPNEIALYQNYPNPFNPSTTIKYSIPSSSVIANEVKQSNEITSVNTFPRNDNANVTLIVYDILGREVATLVNEKQKPGNYEVEFYGADLTSGVYFYKLNVGEYQFVKKMLLLK